MTDKRDI